jgi:hypothetical protein
LGAEMIQRLKVCQNLARKIATENNEKLIGESTKYFNSKIKTVEFREDIWVCLKDHNFNHKNKKMAETFEGLFRITKVHENGTALTKAKILNAPRFELKTYLVWVFVLGVSF